jgi:hypothetical protein
MAVHVPAVIPALTVQSPEQQSVGLKQMSPNDEHVAPEDAQRPAWQLPEQQSEPAPHVFPRVPQPFAVRAAQEPAAQLLEQHSEPDEHFCPFGTQRVAPHFPLAHTLVQHSVGCVQVAPLPRQAGPATPQIFEVGSHTPAQQPAPVVQTSPGPPQLVVAPSDWPLAPADPVCRLPPVPPPPSVLFDKALDELPHPKASALNVTARQQRVMRLTNVPRTIAFDVIRLVMRVGAPSRLKRLIDWRILTNIVVPS